MKVYFFTLGTNGLINVQQITFVLVKAIRILALISNYFQNIYYS